MMLDFTASPGVSQLTSKYAGFTFHVCSPDWHVVLAALISFIPKSVKLR